MQSKGYTEAYADVRLFVDFMGSTIDKVEQVVRKSNAKRQRINGEYQQLERQLQSTKSDADRMCSVEKRRRDNTARHAIEHMKIALSDIKDPHFHRMESKYIRKCGRGTYVSDMDSPHTVKRKLKEAVDRFDELVADLNQAFIPPSISNVVGGVVRPYRKNSYVRIIKARDEILALAEALISFSDLDSQQRECGEVFNTRIEREKADRDAKLQVIPNEMNSGISRTFELFSQGLERLHEETEVLDEVDKSIVVGQCWFFNNNVSILAEAGLSDENVALYEDKVGFRLKMDSIKENMLFAYDGGEGVSQTLCSLAADIVYSCDHMDLVLIDVKGLGSTYRLLQPLNEYDALTLLNTDNQVSEGLERLEKWIADTYEKCLGERYDSIEDYNRVSLSKRNRKCLIIDDLIGNIEPKYFDQILRIMNNGVKAGVYVLCSIENRDFGNNRALMEFAASVREAATVIPVRGNGCFYINNSTAVFLKTDTDQERIASVRCKLGAHEEQSAIIPIGKALPDDGNWQKKSSANGLKVDFGVDENGRKASFEISSERPYGLIIGDVRVGKSSLLHTIIFQLLSNYSPEEVRIAVGDFKDGADFNVYAKGNLQSVDTVVNDEDPDAMLSFLKYYVQEMQARQRAFEQLEVITGVIVQKYEDFRCLYDDHRSEIQPMPRIVILIDEFQSLFDGASCAAYMTELVRKGATYGIHVILSSQRAVSDNPRNGFTASLKDYFTSRFVFKTPQNAARSMLAERCADTGRENTGIQRASLLKKGHTVYNSYMGQNEADNAVVQCYFASSDVIATFIQVIAAMNGRGNSILLKRNAKSLPQPSTGDLIRIGRSVAFHKDESAVDIDTILDDTEVSINPQRIKNMILTGADERILNSIVSSVVNWRKGVKDKQTQIHFFGEYDAVHRNHEGFVSCHYHRSIQEQLDELERQINNPGQDYTVNIFVQPDKYTELTQSAGSIRSNQGVESMKQLLETSGSDRGFALVYSKSFKNLRSNMSYLLNAAPVHITSVGDMENFKYAMSDNVRLVSCDFDVPNKDAIKAYYYNKDTEKAGKVILYRP